MALLALALLPNVRRRHTLQPSSARAIKLLKCVELVAGGPRTDFVFGHQRRVELDYLTGAVIRRAHQSNTPTPALQAIYLTLKARAQSFGGL